MAEQSFKVDGGIQASGIVTATTFAKQGGTSVQFLKADGSVDARSFSTTDTNTTYHTSAADGDTAAKKAIKLVDNANNTVGVVTLVAGSNISLSRQDEEITITGDTVDTDTTYSVAAADGSSGNRKSVVMTAGGSGSGIAGIVTFIGGDNINLTRNDDEITISAAPGTNLTYNVSAVDHESDANKKYIRLSDSNAGITSVILAAGNDISVTRNANEIAINNTAALSDVTSKGATTTDDVTVNTLNTTKHLNVGFALTVTGNTDINGNLDVDAHTDLDNVNVSGVSTFAGNTTIQGNLDIADTIYHTGDSNTKIRFPESDVISFHTGGNEVLRIDQSGNLNATGLSTFAGNIDANGELDVDGHTYLDNVSVSGACTVTGDFTVLGTTTLINSTNLNIGDNILTLNDDVTGTPSENAGIEVERGTSDNVSLRWNETSDKWQYTNDGSSYNNIEDTTYSQSSVADSSNVKLRLTGSDSSNDDITITAGSQVTIDNVTANGFRLNSTATITEVPTGIVVLWSGASNAIPSGWSLCDGSGSTPDLRDKFIVGAGNNYSVDATGGSANTPVVSHSHGSGNYSTSNTGSHTHGSGNYSTSNTGNHSHSQNASFSGNTGNQSANHYHTIGNTSVSTSNTGSHSHSYTAPSGNQGVDTDSHGHDTDVNHNQVSGNTGNAGAHNHTVNLYGVQTLGVSENHTHSFSGNISGNTGNTGSHSHNVNSGSSGSGGSHSHNVSGNSSSTGNSGTNANLPPYYALCYIRKD